MILNVQVYYVFKDSFLSENEECRILINIPKEKEIIYEVGKEIIFCLKEKSGVLTLSNIYTGQKCDSDYLLKAFVIGQFNNNEVSLKPSFSPIKIKNQEIKDSLKYVKGKTAFLSIKVSPSRNGEIKYIDISSINIKNQEPIWIK